jgi:hypothetical protein
MVQNITFFFSNQKHPAIIPLYRRQNEYRRDSARPEHLSRSSQEGARRRRYHEQTYRSTSSRLQERSRYEWTEEEVLRTTTESSDPEWAYGDPSTIEPLSPFIILSSGYLILFLFRELREYGKCFLS